MILVGILTGIVGTWAVSAVVAGITCLCIWRAWALEYISDYRDEARSTLINIEWTLGKLSDVKRDQD